MEKRKIVILGGGMAGLTAAYELTKTAELRERNQVTVYQLGWRLGGKCATGRSDDDRIQEHGLHMWFGCYENAFTLLKDVYEAWKRGPENPLRSWHDAVSPRSLIAVGVPDENGCVTFVPVTWPVRDGEPGSGGTCLRLFDVIHRILSLVLAAVRDWLEAANMAAPGGTAIERLRPLAICLEDACAIGNRLQGVQAGAPAGDVDELVRCLERTRDAHVEAAGVDADPRARLIAELIHLASALLRGILVDLEIHGKDLDDLDELELRDWLSGHGARAEVLSRSSILQALYDACFWYLDGDPTRPNVGAGVGIKVLAKVACEYRGAVTYVLRAGMGEVVVAPLYEVLQDRGVEFAFFRKVKRLELDPEKDRVRRVVLSVQAMTKHGTYQPLSKTSHGLRCWPAEPDWGQLENGEDMRAAKADFESHWCAYPEQGTEMLTEGLEFTDVVLAVSLGAFKRLNGDSGMCDELIAASAGFASMAGEIGLVPTQSLQIWSVGDLPSLGWKVGPAGAVAGEAPFGIWADMTQVLQYEGEGSRETPPKSVQYLCGTLDTELYKAPSNQADVLARATDLVKTNVVRWLEHSAVSCWPLAVQPGGRFQWQVLWGPASTKGPARLDSQYFRANVSPNECCPGSAAGTVKARLRTDEHGFANLYLAGCFVRTGLNTTCVEAAVMSGMQVSRAICGAPSIIPGEAHPRRGG